MTLTIEWADPPQQRRNNPAADELDQAATQLLEHPGRWARVWTDIKTTTAKSRAVSLRDRDPRVRCRIVTHDPDRTTADLYARIPVATTATLQVAS